MTRKPQDIAGKIFETADANRTVHEGKCGFANPGGTVRVTVNGSTITARARTPILPGTAVVVQLADGSYEALQEGAPSEIGQQIIEQERRNEVPTLEPPAIAYVLFKRTIEEKLDCTCPTWNYDGATRKCYPVCDGGSYETLQECLRENKEDDTHPGPIPPPDPPGPEDQPVKFCAPAPITIINKYYYPGDGEIYIGDSTEPFRCIKRSVSRCFYYYSRSYLANINAFQGDFGVPAKGLTKNGLQLYGLEIGIGSTVLTSFSPEDRYCYSGQRPIYADNGTEIPICTMRLFSRTEYILRLCDPSFIHGAVAWYDSYAGVTNDVYVITPEGDEIPLNDWMNDNLKPPPTEGENREPNRIQYFLGGDRATPILVQEFNASDPHDVTASILGNGNPLIVFRHGGEDEEHYCKVTVVEVAGNQTVKTTYEYNTNLKDLPDIWQKPFIRTFDRTPAPAQNPCLQNYQGNNFAYLGSSNALTISLSTLQTWLQTTPQGERTIESTLQTWLQTTPQGERAIQVNGKLASYAVKDNACTLGAEEDQAIELYPIGMKEGDKIVAVEIVAIIPYTPGI